MQPMTKIDLPYVTLARANGKQYSYYRRNGQYQRIKGAPGSLEWLENYQRIHRQHEGTQAPGAAHGSFKALAEAYLASPDFQAKAPKTQKDYRRIIDRLAEKYGSYSVKGLTRPAVFAIRDSYGKTSRTANYVVQVLSLLMTFAVDRGWRTDNPALRIKRLAVGDGHEPWQEHEIDAFRARWPLGTWERTAFELLLNTGQRGQDVAIMSRNQIDRAGWLRVRQQKTKDLVEIPLSEALAEALSAWLPEQPHLALLAGVQGAAPGLRWFRKRMTDAFTAAGCPAMTVHGGRYTAAVTLRELGVAPDVIASITSHRTEQMVRKYSEKRRKARIAVTAMNRPKV